MKTSGFTLVELLIVASIAALLAATGVPAIRNAYVRSLATTMSCDLNNFYEGLLMYSMYNGNYPAPDGWKTPDLVPYLRRSWPATNQFRDQWKWDQVSGRLTDRALEVQVHDPAGSFFSALALLEAQKDDGDLSTGRLTFSGNTFRYYYVLGGEDLDAGGGNNPGGNDPDNPGQGNGNQHRNQHQNQNQNGNGH